jgi:hypothetical protein
MNKTDTEVLQFILSHNTDGSGVHIEALQQSLVETETEIPSLAELETSLQRLQMDGLVYSLNGAYYPL